MPIFKLKPIDPMAPEWEASAWPFSVLVRAADETRARELADAAFGIRMKGLAPPWKTAAIVGCEAVTVPSLEQNGPEGIIDPPPPARGRAHIEER